MEFRYTVAYNVQLWAYEQCKFVWVEKSRVFSDMKEALMFAYSQHALGGKDVRVVYANTGEVLCRVC